MSERNPEVMAMVEQALRREDSVSSKKLKQRAEAIDADIADLSIQQFHARYPLQVARRIQREQKQVGNSHRRGIDRDARTHIRDTLVAFAQDVAAADSSADVIDLVADVDRYVDRVIEVV